MLYHFESAEPSPAPPADRMKTDLDTALTLAQIARQTPDADKAMRNRQNARRGYDAVLRYLSTATLTVAQRQNFERKLVLLKSALVALGESL